MAVFIFIPETFQEQFPEFTKQAPAVLMNYFTMACGILDNTDRSRVEDIPQRGLMLSLLTAHCTLIFGGDNDSAPGQQVGRVSSAGEGPVNVKLDMGENTTNKAWYEQTKYGAIYWRISAPYRSALYIAPPPRRNRFIPQT
jgi:hypothetical protein